MSSRLGLCRFFLRLALVAAAVLGSADGHAVEPPRVADSSLRAVLGAEVSVRLQDGQDRQGVLVRFSKEELTLRTVVLDGQGEEPAGGARAG
jgi:hypothetical protein